MNRLMRGAGPARETIPDSNTARGRVAPGPVARVLALAALLLALPVCAATPWWNADWQFRKSITVKLPPGTASSVVLPVRLHAGNFEFFQDVQPGGADVRFIGADGTPLRHQMEMFDPTVGLMVAWVQVPVKAGSTEQAIWMYYGNQHAPAPPQETIFDPDQMLVLHMSEAQGPPRDATANHDDPAESGAQMGAAGAIGNGAHFDGLRGIRIGGRPTLALSPTGGLSFASWVKLDANSAGGLLYVQEQGENHVRIGIADSKLFADIKDGKRTARLEGTIPVPPNAWHHVAISIGHSLALYVDGTPAGNLASQTLPSIQGDVYIGGSESAAPGASAGGLVGALDEVQVSRVARTDEWARITALGQSPESTLMAYGTDESRGNSGKFAAYLAMMGNLLSQVSLDGLVVITITALMGLASFQVLISKAGLLSRAERADLRFLEEFPQRFRQDLDRIAQEPLQPAAPATGSSDSRTPVGGEHEDGPYAASGVYAMYHEGLQQLVTAARSAGDSIAGLQLGAEAFEAVRAGLDSALVEATNLLNSRLVIMTVAIAGAPFLGLLGTVVGVMITFASIAAAGDVNVNTIAPGVAAAMTATVVGLLVAIPSLFGYNWLATRVARRTSTMEVFADRFLAQLGLFALEARLSGAASAQDERAGAGSGVAHAA